MRVSTQAFFQNSIATLQKLQSDLNSLQEQVATGRRIQRPSDDPVGAARSLNLRESLETLDQYQRNTSQARSRLQLEEQTLTLPDGRKVTFPIDAFSKHCLLKGVDQMGYLLDLDNEVENYETANGSRINTDLVRG